MCPVSRQVRGLSGPEFELFEGVDFLEFLELFEVLLHLPRALGMSLLLTRRELRGTFGVRFLGSFCF